MPQRLPSATTGLLVGFFALTSGARGATQLPIVCVAGSCGANISWLGSGKATSTSVGNTLTVNQTSEQALLNWSSFNVSADGHVIFKQPDVNAVALNQILQASPSQIFGTIQANGQIYLINQNGFVFGPNSQLNVGGLIASTLQLSPQAISGGLLSPIGSSAPALGAVPTPGTPPTPGQILVQTGAQISTAADGQRILLAAQSVTNSGTISAPNGQVILAAGQAVYLQASSDPGLRGLIVEVDSAPAGAGAVQNLAGGLIQVAQGNATLVGLAVNQQGRISATTSTTENGSISLLARDTVNVQTNSNGVPIPGPTRGGTLNLGPQSQTDVLPNTQSTPVIATQLTETSTITLAGKRVELDGGSSVAAPGGDVSITASVNPSQGNSTLLPNPAAQLRIDSGATIDVSGSTAEVPVTRNLVSVQLRGTELADSPLQQNGPLRGQTVIVDARVGTPLANVKADIAAATPRGILELTSTGGAITLDSGGDVVVSSGATLNVSGGQVNYTPGIMQTSLLLKPDGTTVDIGSASPNQVYSGVVNPEYKLVSNAWGVIQLIPTPGIAHYDPGYTQGMSAGSIQVEGSSLVLAGSFLGQAVNGIYQRSGTGLASGGTFTIGLTPAEVSSLASTGGIDFRASSISLVNNPSPIVVDPNASLPSALPLELPTSLLTQGGFTHLQLSANDSINVPFGPAIDFAPGGSLIMTAPRIDIGAPIKIPAGTIQATAMLNANMSNGANDLGIAVGNDVVFDVGGMWVNDSLLPLNVTPTGLALVNAGSVSLTEGVPQGTLNVGAGVQILADGGAFQPRSGSLTPGAGGGVALIGGPGGIVQFGAGDVIAGFGVQGTQGGSFTLQVPRLSISSGGSAWLPAQRVDSDPASTAFFSVDAALFSNFGFSQFKLTANGPRIDTGSASGAAGSSNGAATPNADVLRVMPDTSIDLQTSTLLLGPAASSMPSGTPITSFASATLLPLYNRAGAQLTLQAVPVLIANGDVGDLSVAAGATFRGDPGASFTFASVGNLNFAGVIDSPSSAVVLQTIQSANDILPTFTPVLTLAPSSAIDVAGTVVYQPSNVGQLIGQVLPGGSVTLAAAQGPIVTSSGSSINFSGTQAPIDFIDNGPTGPQRQTVASAAGSLSISAPSSISLLGTYEGEPGVGTTGRAAGGSLSIDLLSLVSAAQTALNVITVQPDAPTSILDPAGGNAVFGIAPLVASGVDELTLVAGRAIEFTNGAGLKLTRGLTLTTPALEVASQMPVNITAPYLALGTGNNTRLSVQSATPGAGVINFSGDAIDLIGALAFQGVGQATVKSSGEILLLGNLSNSGCVSNCTNNVGSLAIAGELTLSAARVVATTDVNFTMTASGGASNRIEFTQNGSIADPPLAAAGTLTVNADTIIQGGTLYAPFGQLNFNAADALTFAPGSLTSVSGTATVIPYGQVQNGVSWIYEIGANQLVPTAVTRLPTREVAVSGAHVTLASGATLDVSGGGNLSAYSFTPGTTGTVDVLANSSTPAYYAVLPSLLGQSAPYDPMLWDGFVRPPDTSIYLSSGGGLAAGTYPLLPARYALLPGAYLVSVAAGYQDLPPGGTGQAGNGYPIVSGRFTFGNTGIGDTRTTGFLIEPGSYAMQLANYTNNAASTFFVPKATDTPPNPSTQLAGPLPADAGTLQVSIQSTLDVLGKIDGAAASGGQGATIEISAPQIIVDPGAYIGPSSVPGQIHLASTVLDAANAGRLWLGAQSAANGVITVTASSVEVSSGASLAASEVLLAGTNSVAVDGGASVHSSALSADPQPPAAAASAASLPLAGNSTGAALLIASDLNYWVPDRSAGASALPPATLTLNTGATVSSRGALTLDAPGGGTLSDGTLTGVGAQWSIGSGQLTFGPQGAASGGFALDGSLIGALADAGTVRFASSGVINLQQAVNLSGTSIGEIDFIAPGLVDAVGAAANFAARLVTLTGAAAAGEAPTPGTGTLKLTAQEIDLDAGNFALSGFAATTLDASNTVVGSGNGSFSAAGSVNILSPLLTAASGAQTELSAAASLILAPSARPSSGTATLQSGGELSFAGQWVTDSTLISVPSGEVSISAAQQLTLGTGAAIDVSGRVPANAPHGSDGGSITLSAGGALTAASGSSLSVAAAAGADAGAIDVIAGGAVDIASQLNGSGVSGGLSGSFTLQAASIVNFAGLNAALEQAGFHETRSIEVRAGDLLLQAGSSINARNVALIADTGAVTIGGSIDASSPSGGGIIDLSSAGNVSLSASAQLSANGTPATAGNSGTAGGQIEIVSAAGAVQFDPQASVIAQGSAGTGSLLVRAPRNGNDVNILGLPADLTHLGAVVLEADLPSTVGPLPTAADFNAIESTLASYMASARPAILARLFGGTVPSNVVVRPYADITTADQSPAGSLTLPDLDFGTWRFGGQPADISIRAGGLLTVAGTVSDGFGINPSTDAIDVSGGPSARISLVAGADFTSASARAVSGAAADLALAPNAIVRTGTGDVELTAARDILFGQGASVYTGGTAIPEADPNVVDTFVPVSFVTSGGGISLSAGRDVVGSRVTEPIDQWNPRFQPGGAGPALWGIDFQAFDWNLGALAGGNLSIHAGQNISNLMAVVADSRGLSQVDETTLLPSSGGNLTLSAGGDIDSGMFYVANGIGRINSGGSLGSAALTPHGAPLGTLLLAGDTSYYVSAQRGILLEGVDSETAFAPGFNSDYVIFFRNEPNSTLAVQSRGGSIAYNSDVSRVPIFGIQQSDTQAFQLPPPIVDLAAFGGDLVLSTNWQGLPSSTGQLSLYASRDIMSPTSAIVGLSDQPLAVVPTADNPAPNGLPSDFISATSYEIGLLHQNDPQPVLISAGRDISGIGFQIPKQADVMAGRDIVSVSFGGQNLNPTDITSISAGRNLEYPNPLDTGAFLSESGPGQFEIIAGGTIDLGVTSGISTFGNINNGNLPSGGASITVLGGLGAPIGIGASANSSDFVGKIVGASATYQSMLVTYVEQQTGATGLSYEAAAQIFRGFSVPEQLPLVDPVFFSELTLSGQEANQTPSLGFGRGYAAIDALFPGSRGSASPDLGDLSLGYTRIYTVQGGSISLLLPGGNINVGLVNPPVNAGLVRPPSGLGIVAVQAGDVDSYSLESILVNQSRLFTLGGGNIVIWSTLGNIDAGNGAKSSISAPPPTVTVDANGNVTLNFSAAVAGSGIRTIQSEPDVPAGNVSLIAPVGFVNAGDAGIGAAGNINIAAQQVIGASNINFGGTATGVPPEVSGVNASLSGASSAANSSSNATANAAENAAGPGTSATPLANDALGWLDVFVEGFGEELCKADDIECLKRNRKTK